MIKLDRYTQILILILLLTKSSLAIVYGQNKTFQITLHARVDTTKTEVKQIADLWINYLHSTPDSIYNNPYWNSEEKVKFKDFDFSRAYLYPFSSNQILRYYLATILSIEKEGDAYGIRTIFSADGLEGTYRAYNPWCITKLFAVKENNQWKLKNALPIITKNWIQNSVGKINFIYSESHKFNNELAHKSVQFCNSIVKEFQLPDWEPFDFYITSNGDELGKLINFDFFYTGYTTGIGNISNRMLLSGRGVEFYPHEFIHLILPKFDRHQIIEEGFATWKGGQGDYTFEQSASTLANALMKNDTVTFSNVLNYEWGWEVAAFYTSGAILCKAVYDKGGLAMVKSFLSVRNNDEDLLKFISNLFAINQNEINSWWKREVLKYYDN
jgi:hypothetical protein